MSTKASGATDPIDHRVSVGMTEAEHAALAAKAQHAGLSLARYLVEAGGQIDGLKPVVTAGAKEFQPQVGDRKSVQIRGPRGRYWSRSFWHFVMPPCDLSRGSDLTRWNPCFRAAGAEWVERAYVGDVVVWEAAAIRDDGGFGEVVGYRVGMVQMRAVKMCGWHRSKEATAVAVDAILAANGRTP